ncbi:MAG: transposase [Patescibacteria group bacterium]
MPAKHALKEFVSDSYYHIYNRGVEKRTIFVDAQDYAVFLSYLKTYLLPKDESALRAVLLRQGSVSKEKDNALKLLRLNNFSYSMKFLAYCLMPNHFHFLVKQTEAETIDHFMRSFCTRYSLYFNRKYHRVGGLFQGVYKAVLVRTDEQLQYLTRYIHRNSLDLPSEGASFSEAQRLLGYPYSSYPEYLEKRSSSWIQYKDIRKLICSTAVEYEKFVCGRQDDEGVVAGYCLDD